MRATSSELLSCAPDDVGFETDVSSVSPDSAAVGLVGLLCLSSERDRSFVDSITVEKKRECNEFFLNLHKLFNKLNQKIQIFNTLASFPLPNALNAKQEN